MVALKDGRGKGRKAGKEGKTDLRGTNKDAKEERRLVGNKSRFLLDWDGRNGSNKNDGRDQGSNCHPTEDQSTKDAKTSILDR